MKLTFKQTAFAALASVALVLGVGSAFFPGFNSNLVVSRAVNGDLSGYNVVFTRAGCTDNSYPASGSGTYIFGKQLPGDTYVYSNMENSLSSGELGKLRINNGTTLKFTKDKAGSIEFLFQSINSIYLKTPTYPAGGIGYDLTIQYSTNGKTFNNYAAHFGNSSADLEITISASSLSSDPIKMIRVQNSSTDSKASLNLNQVTLNIDCSYSYVEESSIVDVSLNKSSTKIVTGYGETLVATVLGNGPYDDSVAWTSSDDSVVSVSNGVLTGVSAGTATVTATSVQDNTYYDTCEVTVVDLNGITVQTAPSKVNYDVDDNFNPAGLVIRASYSDSTYENISYSGHEDLFSFSPSLSTSLTTDITSITISYLGESVSQSITVSSAASGLSGTYAGTYTSIEFTSSTTCTYIYGSERLYATYVVDGTKITFTYVSGDNTSFGSYRLFKGGSSPKANATGVIVSETQITVKTYDMFDSTTNRTFTKQ